jgi:hypothetical protein
MATVSTVTIGADDFSVYNLDNAATPLANLESFWNGRLGAVATAVAAAVDADQNRALVMASDWIDRSLNFSGDKTSSTQARSWPRDNAKCNETAIDDGTTPDSVANAAFWLAGQLLVDATIADSSGQGSNIKSAKAGSAEVQFFTPTIGGASDTRLPKVAMDYLICLIDGGSLAAGKATGTSSSSAFDEDDFEVSEGWY